MHRLTLRIWLVLGSYQIRKVAFTKKSGKNLITQRYSPLRWHCSRCFLQKAVLPLHCHCVCSASSEVCVTAGIPDGVFSPETRKRARSSLQDGGGFLIWMAGWDRRGPGGRSGEGDGGDRRFALPCAVLGAEGQSLQVLSQRQRRSRGSTEPPSPSHRPRGGTSPRLGLQRQVPSPRLS